jgi:hypothetical protein
MNPSGNRRVAGWTALTAGLGASVAGALLAIHSARPPADIGSLPDPAAPATAAARVTGTPSPAPRSPDDDWAPPTRITIAALHVDAPVEPVSARAGALSIPDNPADLGWWLGSATPGAGRGTVLVAGHVDTAADGPGALFRLEQLPMGSVITARTGSHSVAYRAVARRSYDKQHLPAALFRPDSAPQLVLVTCGGTFRNGAYSHNVVVYATPVT